MNILCITPIDHLPEVKQELNSLGVLNIIEDPTLEEISEELKTADIIFTNPNKSKIFIGEELVKISPNLKIVCTASTGTNHIDKDLLQAKNIQVISITIEKDVIEKISSTAEHALALTFSSLRSVQESFDSVKRGEWDYTPYIGRQFDNLCVGIVGLGRLGSMYARFVKPLAKKIVYYDPYVSSDDPELTKAESLEELFGVSDIVSLHVHVTHDTIGLVNQEVLRLAKEDLLLVNTSRGEIVNQEDVISFLKVNKKAKYATDVIEEEVKTINKISNPLVKFSSTSNQVLITPHIGGMTYEAQNIAYGHAVNLLKQEIQCQP